MEIKIAVAKIDKYGSGNSGDTVETIERPNGGLSAVLADGQIDGHDNKTISTMVSHRVIDHITDGVRDSAAIRAASNNIFLEHNGSVSANLDVLTVDLQTNTILISRNSPVPVFLVNEDLVDCLSSECEPIGGRVDISPSIVELQIQAGMKVVVFSDGVFNAGRNNQQSSDFCTTIQALIEEQEPSAQEIADFLLNQAIRLDDGRPKDDMSVIVLMLRAQSNDRIRRMSVSMAMGES